ncbi:hypothetical protein MTO96_005752 [Rhipicephalus appendiculatus]
MRGRARYSLIAARYTGRVVRMTRPGHRVAHVYYTRCASEHLVARARPPGSGALVAERFSSHPRWNGREANARPLSDIERIINVRVAGSSFWTWTDTSAAGRQKSKTRRTPREL